MLLSKLELCGFKSFPNRTELSFDEGIMAVVGPNGCGKTNILDSIRWVLGEQRSSLIRGSKMEEVLFNGSGQQKPADMAEVSLTIKNNRGILPLEYEELVISRRLYRSGESEYSINKSVCRLKDIIDLFADTGMGTHAYSLFQPSMIDSVLSDSAEERRYMFEEAAGITRYKSRKKEALRKLENTEIDLVRLGDIINEISKNVRALKRQASKVRRYKAVKERLKNLEITRASAQVFEIEQRIKELSTKINDLKTDRQVIKTAIDKQEAAIENLKLEIIQLDESISAKALRIAELNEKAMRLENEITSIQTRLSSGSENVRLWNSEIEGLKQRVKSMEAQQSQIKKQRSEKSSELESLNQKTIEVESGVISLKEKLDRCEATLESLKESQHRFENEKTANQAKLEGTLSSIGRLTNLCQNLDLSLKECQAKREALQGSLELHREKLKECNAEIVRTDEQLNINRQKQLSLISRIDDLKTEISSCNAERSAVEAKLEVLSQMIIHHEGYGSGVRALFSWPDKPEGVIDTLANLLTVNRRYHSVVEAALNKYGQLVVCRSRDDAYRCIDYLKSNSAGRVGFLLLDNAGQTSENIKPVESEGYISSVADLIDCMDYLKPAVKRLFADIAVFEAGKIPENYYGEAVDLDSNYYNYIGIVEGGRSDVSLIGKKDELSGLQDLLNSLKMKLDSFEQSLHQCQSSLAECNKDISVLDEKKRTLLSERETMLTDLTGLEFEFKENANRYGQLSSDNAEAGKQSETLNHQKNEINRRIAENKTHLQELSQQHHQMSAEHRALVGDYESDSKELNRLRLQSVELSGLLQKLGGDEKRTSELLDEAKKMIDKKSEVIDAEHVSWQKLENQKKDIKVQLVEVSEAKEDIENDRINLNGEKNRLTGQISESEGKLKNLRQESGTMSEEIHQKELKLADLKNSLKSIEESIFGEHGIRVTGIIEEGYDESLINSEAERLKNVLEKVGPVNMLADEEYNNEKDRLEFLEAQYADLQEAKSSLKDAIRKINQTAKEKFADTFELIRENFQKVFETLFEGGVVEVKLTEPDDLLESPIEITARPKGKRLVSVNQLSGGERALTAISLLFAIYMVKPSPFCILDEIDAPLDDANISRFLKLINKFTQTTQFVVITHNKKTMEAAGILYGVTMDTPGVSNIVSVKFDGDKPE